MRANMTIAIVAACLALVLGALPVSAADMTPVSGEGVSLSGGEDAPTACGTFYRSYTCKQIWSYSEPLCPGGTGWGYYVRTQEEWKSGSTTYYKLWSWPGNSVNTYPKCAPETSNLCKNATCWS